MTYAHEKLSLLHDLVYDALVNAVISTREERGKMTNVSYEDSRRAALLLEARKVVTLAARAAEDDIAQARRQAASAEQLTRALRRLVSPEATL